MNIIGHYINGRVVETGENFLDVDCPSTGEIESKLAMADKALVYEVINVAQKAQEDWRKTPPAKRAQIFARFKTLVENNSEKLCELIGKEHGKISHDAMGELIRGIENIEYAAGIPELLKGEFTKDVGGKIDSWSQFEPLGVVVGITPFNFPAMVPLWMYPMAIACGNSFILKPSERVPSAQLFLAGLLQKAGLPDGVFNIINGDKEVVDALLQDDRVEAVSFVGSTPIAQYVYQEAARYGKRCQALGGAKNHAIVMPDADLDNAVDQLIGAAFGSSGERCMALSVAVAVGDDVADALIAKLTEQMKSIKVGHYSDKANSFGAVISQEHKERIEAHISSAVEQGARLVVDGRDIQVPPSCENGYYIGATLIDNVTAEMTSYQAEIFGPVLQVVRVDSMEEAVTLINDNMYGNGTCLFTRDGEAARYFSDEIKVGMVGINIPLPVPVAYHSFGGWKQSRFGDLCIYGPDAVRFYTDRKTITQRWPSSGVREGIKYSFPS
ncbi:CoA-acylating methylmalonate-semialdehyde dehydrogenase [Photobacterium atrarenae]|uniref:methylmalonate-semialdehyde dehydrogenase (CoA acylating) n=1 Tax=Photobacterium atrarenae TaxID=865757 RepID=A0ABY5GNS2_9GAMM|nr:CoA-acylating methylmalonate-semialdehyde dehydrogenase [Photobacterium atrarenae]UTV30734.1 CoA-acylating methylmalonate-semialdehyde dehydrogenase [Photobacterium atrarenae]